MASQEESPKIKEEFLLYSLASPAVSSGECARYFFQQTSSLRKVLKMPETIEAIYEDGIFRPLTQPHLKDHEKVELTISIKSGFDESVRHALSIIGLGESPFADTSQDHDEYLYGPKRLGKDSK